jgi:hypothetical protein
MIESGTIDRDAVNKRDAFSRIKNAMVGDMVEERSGFIWPLPAGGMFSNIPSPPIQMFNLPPLPL